MKTLASLILLVLVPAAALGHDGLSFEKEVGGYFIDVGYSGTESLDTVRLDFALSDAQTREEVPFTDIWVKISKGEKLVFAGPIANGEFGLPGMSLVFPEPGFHDVYVRFESGDDEIIEETFSFDISEGDDPSPKASALVYAGLGASFLAGGALGALLARSQKKHVK